MGTTRVRNTQTGPPGFALLMESDVDLRALIGDALEQEGHRVERFADCAAALSFCARLGPVPDGFVLGLGAGELDPDWEELRIALDETRLAKAAVIVLLTIRNGFVFPARARIVQKPFDLDALLELVSADMAAAGQA